MAELKDFKLQWVAPNGDGGVRTIRVHADALAPIRQMKKLLGAAWEALEAHVRSEKRWNGERAMGANFHSGKLWYTEGDAVVNLMKVKLDHNGTISIVPNFFHLDKI